MPSNSLNRVSKDYQAYLFDWDGTLAQTLEVWLGILRIQFKEYGLSVTDEQIAEKFGNWKAALEFGLPESEIDTFIKELEERSHKAIADAPLYPGVKKVLTDLKKEGKQLGLLTSTMRRTIDIVLHHHDLAELFDIVVTGTDVKEHKPHPECIEFAVTELNVASRKAVMIGDSDKDIGAATNAGVDSVLWYPKSHEFFHDLSRLKTYNPTYVISDWEQLRP